MTSRFWRHLQIVLGGSRKYIAETIKAGAAIRELSIPILTSTHVEAASPVLAPSPRSFINHVVNLSQVLHIAQDDLLYHYSKM